VLEPPQRGDARTGIEQPSREGKAPRVENFNPLKSQLDLLESTLVALHAERVELLQWLEWHDGFDPDATSALIVEEEAQIADDAARIAELSSVVADTKSRADRIRPATLRGWNPLYWLSAERALAQRKLAGYLKTAAELESEVHQQETHRQQILERLTEDQESMAEYAVFDRGQFVRRLDELAIEIDAGTFEAEALRPRSAALELDLEAPLALLMDSQARIQALQQDIAEAEALERKLNRASNSYEKAMVHQECERRFGAGSPSAVVRQTTTRIATANRDSSKLERRLRDISRRGSLDIRSVVVDGSNLCYEGDRLIGLFALRALCARLAGEVNITVVFDNSIRVRLGLPNDRVLRSQLPGIKVHVMASKRGADETILDLADEPTSFVVSNDNYSDFRDKAAVRDSRIIRHEIVNDRVLVRDLRIDVAFDRQGE
jgi:hypothetical protein